MPRLPALEEVPLTQLMTGPYFTPAVFDPLQDPSNTPCSNPPLRTFRDTKGSLGGFESTGLGAGLGAGGGFTSSGNDVSYRSGKVGGADAVRRSIPRMSAQNICTYVTELEEKRKRRQHALQLRAKRTNGSVAGGVKEHGISEPTATPTATLTAKPIAKPIAWTEAKAEAASQDFLSFALTSRTGEQLTKRKIGLDPASVNASWVADTVYSDSTFVSRFGDAGSVHGRVHGRGDAHGDGHGNGRGYNRGNGRGYNRGYGRGHQDDEKKGLGTFADESKFQYQNEVSKNSLTRSFHRINFSAGCRVDDDAGVGLSRPCVLHCFARVAKAPPHPTRQAAKSSLSSLQDSREPRDVPQNHGFSFVRPPSLLRKFAHVYRESYVCRLYVYRGYNLSGHGTAHDELDPFLRVSNGSSGIATDSAHINEIKATAIGASPAFYQVVELACVLPYNGDLVVTALTRSSLGSSLGSSLSIESCVGKAVLDIESRVLHGRLRCEKEYISLYNEQYGTSQGKLLVRLHILRQSEASELVADDIVAPSKRAFQLRMVIWETRGVRFPEERRKGKTVDQQIHVTTNFDGKRGNFHTKTTDIAWYAAHGGAEWNHRMVWDIKYPCTNPRIKLALVNQVRTVLRAYLLRTIYTMCSALPCTEPFARRPMLRHRACFQEKNSSGR